MHRTALTIALIALAGCTDDPIETCCAATPADLTQLTHATACSDTSFHAWSDDDTVGLSVWLPELLIRADGGDLQESGSLTDLGATIAWETGAQLSSAYCSDAISAEVASSFVGGTATLDVSVTAAVAPATSSTGTLVLTDVELHNLDTGEAIGFPSFTFDALPIATNWGG